MNNPFSFLNNFYNINQSAKLQEVLASENVKLDEILDEEALTQDFKDNKAYVAN